MLSFPAVIVVVDTSVFVAALLGPRGASRQTLRLCLEGRLAPLMGAALFHEYESLLGREQFFDSCALSAAERWSLFDAFLSVCRWTRIYYLWRPNLRDETDNHLLELAVAGGAAAVVTKNVRDLRRSELLFPALRILKPEELAQEMGSWEP